MTAVNKLLTLGLLCKGGKEQVRWAKTGRMNVSHLDGDCGRSPKKEQTVKDKPGKNRREGFNVADEATRRECDL